MDVVPDVLGWLLIVHATRRLGDDDKAAQLSLWTSLAATVLSLADVVRVALVSALYDLVLGAALLLFFTYLAVLAARADDHRASQAWLRLRTAVLVLTAAGVFFSVFGRIGVAGQFVLAFLVATVVTLVACVVLLAVHSGRPWAQPGAGTRPLPDPAP